MTSPANLDALVPANDDLTMVDHLLAAYRMTQDPFGRHLIELALINEGRKIAQDNPACCVSPTASQTESGRLAEGC